MYLVCNVPVMHPNSSSSDDWYLRNTPGLYPDMLKKLDIYEVQAFSYTKQSVFVTSTKTQKI